uniref:Uncharacterized protein n=1 Tax=Octopus bimaculoides TaxID=37653 RepID=A0A0L8HHN2_OCTBM
MAVLLLHTHACVRAHTLGCSPLKNKATLLIWSQLLNNTLLLQSFLRAGWFQFHLYSGQPHTHLSLDAASVLFPQCSGTPASPPPCPLFFCSCLLGAD